MKFKLPDPHEKPLQYMIGTFTAGIVAAGIGAAAYDGVSHQIANALRPPIDPAMTQLMWDPGKTPANVHPSLEVPMDPGEPLPEGDLGPGNFSENKAPGQAAPTYSSRNFLVLERSNNFYPGTKDPIWVLSYQLPDGKTVSFETVVGRADRQHDKVDRMNTPGNKSPLPPGMYSVGQPERIQPGWDPELGKEYWIPIEPQFRTARSALGIHVDPSIGKRNGESGTSGCIGFVKPGENSVLAQLIRKYGIRQLRVVS